jgi:hypothetical protein
LGPVTSYRDAAGYLSAPVVNAPATAVGGNLAATTSYYYVVKATNAGLETGASVQVSATTTSGANAQLTVVLNWQPVIGATGYNVYRGTTFGGENRLVASVAGTSYSDTAGGVASPALNPPIAFGGGNLTAGTYYYILTATTASGESTDSNEVLATLLAGNQTVSLSWGAVAGATGYKLYRATSPGGELRVVATLGAVPPG